MNLQSLTMYEACLLHSRAERVLKNIVSDNLRQWDITRMGWLVVATVAAPSRTLDGHSMGEIAAAPDIKLSQLNALVARLVAADYLQQAVATHDKRIKYLQKTAKSEKLLEEIEHELRQGMRQWLHTIKREDLATYMIVLQQLGNTTDM